MKNIIIGALLLCTPLFGSAQEKNDINDLFTSIDPSPKPEFNDFCRGIKTWAFGKQIYNGEDISNIEMVDFGGAYVQEEVYEFLNAILPDAPNRIDYTNKSTNQLMVDLYFTSSTYLNRNGSYTWNITCTLIFRDFFSHYTYSFKIPQIRVRGGNFGDHSLYNALLTNVTNQKLYYSQNKELQLYKILSRCKEETFKQNFYYDSDYPFDGIYEAINLQDGGKLKLAVLAHSLIYYFGGVVLFDDWSEGEIKGWLTPTAIPTVFKGSWSPINKGRLVDAYVTFDSGSMTIKIGEEVVTYLKLFPNSTSIKRQPAQTSGTGFALKNGYIVTNYHVVENAKSIYVQGVNGNFTNRYRATLIASDKYNDLALLQIVDNNFKGFGTIPYNVKTAVSEVGEDIFVLGYPLTSSMGNEIKLTTGVISSKTGFQGDVSLYQISAPIQPGNSGGPLFDNKGNLVGIVNAKHKGAENVGYAIKVSYLKNLIESSISTSILPNNNQTAGLPLTGKVKSLKNYVFMISCSNQETNHIVANNVSNNTNEGHQTYTQSNNYIEYPIIGSTTAERAKIKSVRLTEEYTAIEIISNNQSGSTYYQWCNIDRNTYISANGKQYTMNRAEGIKIAPEKTYFTHAGQNITFTLYFPPLPESVKSINLIETIDSDWKFYGIKIR